MNGVMKDNNTMDKNYGPSVAEVDIFRRIMMQERTWTSRFEGMVDVTLILCYQQA